MKKTEGSLYRAHAVSGPTLEHVTSIANKHGLDISEDDLKAYQKIMKESCDALCDVDLLPEPSLPTKYPRIPGYRPMPEENVLNAWYWKTNVTGAETGKIAGKKIAVKDNIAVAGVPMMVGCSALEGYVPEFDATVVTRLLDEGGTVLGKSTCESLCGSGASFTCNKGPVLNFHNPLHDAGGSSGGSATLVASGEVDLAIGSDQGGSVRLPASWCGVVGLKPTHGLVPYTGAMCFEASVDHLGPMASNVHDCALMLEVLAGYDDGLDPRQRQDMVVPEYTKEIQGDNLDGIKIGIVSEGFGWDDADPKVEDLVRKSVEKLTKVGATVTDISVPLHKLSSVIWKQVYVEGFTDTVFKTGGVGRGASGFYPTSLSSFACKSFKTRINDISHSAKLYFLLGEYFSERYPGSIYSRGQNLRRSVTKAYNDVLREFDVLVMPTIPFTSPKLPEKQLTTEEYLTRLGRISVNTRCANLTGHPAISVNAGFLYDGLPVGAMFIGRHFEEVTLLKVAENFEKLVG